jgi:hypothetical protein
MDNTILTVCLSDFVLSFFEIFSKPHTYRHCTVFIKCSTSFCKNSFTGLSESSLGVAEKYSAPRRKCLIESVMKNWLDVAVLPRRLK